MAEPVITAAQLAEHASEADVWLSIHGKVYDVTKYLADHPGGMDVMLEHGGEGWRVGGGGVAAAGGLERGPAGSVRSAWAREVL